MDPADQPRVLAFVTGFFAQFARPRDQRRTIRPVHHAAWNFQFDGVRALAKLLDHDQLIVRSEGDDVYPIDGVDDKELVLDARAR